MFVRPCVGPPLVSALLPGHAMLCNAADCLTRRVTNTAPHTLRYRTALGLVQRCTNRASGKQHLSIPEASFSTHRDVHAQLMASDALTHGSGTDSGTASAASAGAAAGGVRASPQASPSPPAAGEARLQQHPQQSVAPDRAGSTGPESGGNALPPAPSMAARRKRRSSGDPNSGGAAPAGPGAAAAGPAGSPPQVAAMAASAKEAAASAASAFAVAAAATGSPVMVVGEPSKSVPEFQLTTRTSSKPDPRKQVGGC